MEMLKFGNDVAMRRKLAARKHWILRGRVSAATGGSISDLVAPLGSILEVTPELAQQLRVMGGFNVLRFRPRMGASSDHDIPWMDRLGLLRQAIGFVLSLSLNLAVAVGALCLSLVHKLDALFVKAIMALRAHVLKRGIDQNPRRRC